MYIYMYLTYFTGISYSRYLPPHLKSLRNQSLECSLPWVSGTPWASPKRTMPRPSVAVAMWNSSTLETYGICHLGY